MELSAAVYAQYLTTSLPCPVLRFFSSLSLSLLLPLICPLLCLLLCPPSYSYRALEVITRVQAKLTGRDFATSPSDEEEDLTVEQQVHRSVGHSPERDSILCSCSANNPLCHTTHTVHVDVDDDVDVCVGIRPHLYLICSAPRFAPSCSVFIRLIQEASSVENLCQLFQGWCPLW